MKFCRQCGQALAILDRSILALCPACTLESQKKKAVVVGNTDSSADIVAYATISVRDGKIVIESKEGWLLWSGSDKTGHSLQQILDRASRILKIRTRKTR